MQARFAWAAVNVTKLSNWLTSPPLPKLASSAALARRSASTTSWPSRAS